MSSPEWYLDWFNSPYYHLLYNHRNDKEAQFFIENLYVKLRPPAQAKAWDLACGKGRHSLALHRMGFDVTGTDLSENSIFEAKSSSEDGLDFFVHDMRNPFRINYFDYVFNLFTSLGYFENEKDNLRVFKNVHKALKPGGTFVVDFFNSHKVLNAFRQDYTENRNGIEFRIKKQIKNKCILKHIDFRSNEKEYYFEEKVSLLDLNDFENLAKSSQFVLTDIYGNYKLETYDRVNSDRLILFLKKQG